MWNVAIIVISIWNVEFLPAFELGIFLKLSAFASSFLLKRTHSQNINKRPEIKRFRCFFFSLLLFFERRTDCQQKRRNSQLPYEPCTSQSVGCVVPAHFHLISDNNLHKSFFGIFHQSKVGIMLKTQDFIPNNFHDTQNCEYRRLSAGKSQRFFHTTSTQTERERKRIRGKKLFEKHSYLQYCLVKIRICL